jgi:hypothetical protein
MSVLREQVPDDSTRAGKFLPIRADLQCPLWVISQRLDELINDNGWIYPWIESIRAWQELSIMEDGQLNWLLCGILSQSAEIGTARLSASTDADATLRTIT